MADYDALDESTLEQMLSAATSYEERAALRQVLRKRKKERGVTSGRAKPRGNSVYNRFAGSSAPKSTVKSGGANVVPVSSKPKQGAAVTPTPMKPSQSPAQSPAQSPVQPTVVTPVTPQSPEPPKPSQSVAEEESEPHDDASITVGLDEEAAQHEQATDTPEEEVTEQSPQEARGEEPDVGINQEASPPEHDQAASDAVEPSYHHEEKPDSSATGDLHSYLVAYVNQTLFLDPPLPSKGRALYETCSDPTLLCKLINKSVSGTVDMRALSKISGSTAQRNEALQDNMTLVIESARAIGCQISDFTHEKILQKHPETIKNFLVDLIRARVVHMPGMEDEPASTFSDMQSLFQKLHISVDDDSVSWRDDSDKVRKALQATVNPTESGSWRESQADTTGLTYEQRAALRKAEREQRQKEKETSAGSVELTYEERAAQRRAERERRKREREALAK